MTTIAKAALRRAGIGLSRVRADDRTDYQRLYPACAIEHRRFYNIGAGTFRRPCWTNVDRASEWYGPVGVGVLSHDPMADAPLPVASGTAELVYTSHTIEHVTEAAARRLFGEAHRILKPGGIFRITCPDADLACAALQAGDADFFYADEDASARFDTHYRTIHRDPPNTRPLAERWLHTTHERLRGGGSLAAHDRSRVARVH